MPASVPKSDPVDVQGVIIVKGGCFRKEGGTPFSFNIVGDLPPQDPKQRPSIVNSDEPPKYDGTESVKSRVKDWAYRDFTLVHLGGDRLDEEGTEEIKDLIIQLIDQAYERGMEISNHHEKGVTASE